MTNRPRIFIGSATETLPIARQLKTSLRRHASVHLWNAVIELGEFTIPALQRQAASCDFAIFVWGDEDTSITRGKRKGAPRDNVVYEAGLFAGALGEHRVFVVHARDTKVPSDLLGVTTGQFDAADPDLKPISRQIRRRIEELGHKPATRLAGHWWQVVLTEDDSSVVSFFEIEPDLDGRSVSLAGKAWASDSEVAWWSSTAASFDEEHETLHYSWEGRKPRKAGVPEFQGVGSIHYHDMQDMTGEFSSSPRSASDGRGPTRIKSTIYMRAEPDEITTMTGRNRVARKKLVATKLQLRRDLY